MDESKAGSRIEKEAWERESNWLSLAIAGGVLLLIGAGFILLWILAVDKDAERLTRVQIAAPFGALAVAAITFFTIVWRGLISARQADTGLQQLEGFRRQLDLTEENNLSALLQKGSELLADESSAKVSAGIATLQAVAAAPNRKFRGAASTMLLDYIQEQGRSVHTKLVRQAIAAVNAAAKANGEQFDVTLDFVAKVSSEGESPCTWALITGAEMVNYDSGKVEDHNFKDLNNRLQMTIFNNVDFVSCRDISWESTYIGGSRFNSCSFLTIDDTSNVHNSFVSCDFSNAEIGVSDIDGFFENCEDCYFFEDQPPRLQEGDDREVNWRRHLKAFDEIPF